MALKYHPETQSKEGTSDEVTPGDRAKKRLAIDIWVVRASQTKQSANSPAFVSKHRYLGKALMDTRYARRVVLDQLSTAAQYLIAKQNNAHKI